jgi:hypothetical protein
MMITPVYRMTHTAVSVYNVGCLDVIIKGI